MTFQHALATALIAGATCLSTPSRAEEGFHLELAVGSSKLTDGSASLPDSASAVGIVGRQTWPGGWGVEGGVRGHGEWVVNDGAVTARPNATSYLVGLTYDLPVGPVNLGVRVGAHAWRISGRYIGPGSTFLGRFEDSGGGLYHSLGASIGITERLSISAFYNVFHLEDSLKVKGLDLRASYRF